LGPRKVLVKVHFLIPGLAHHLLPRLTHFLVEEATSQFSL
jgi:hypothetical protein